MNISAYIIDGLKRREEERQRHDEKARQLPLTTPESIQRNNIDDISNEDQKYVIIIEL